jgi:AraC-like DNA-binding protein
MEGWRVSGRAVEQTRPRIESAIAHDVVPQPDPRDWRALGESWNAAIVAGEYWRDPEITLALVAVKLGTNTTTLSRAINMGLGQNFNEMMNRHRVAAIQRVLDDPGDERDLLEIAFDAGFRSNASFNRAFALYAAMTPGEYRKRTRFRAAL